MDPLLHPVTDIHCHSGRVYMYVCVCRFIIHRTRSCLSHSATDLYRRIKVKGENAIRKSNEHQSFWVSVLSANGTWGTVGFFRRQIQ